MTHMAFLLALVAGLVLVHVGRAGGDGVRNGGARGGQTVPRWRLADTLKCMTVFKVPGHMVGSTAAVALDRRKGGSVQRTPRRRRTGGEAATSAVGTGAREVTEPTAILDDERERTLRECAEPDQTT